MDGVVSTPSGSTTTGPATFSELPSTAWSGDSSSPTPTSEPTTDSASAATTEPPVETSAPDGTTPGNGEPPKERWPDILANARAKEREAAIAEYRQKVGWAENANPKDVQQMQQIARHFASGDVEQGLRSFLAELRKDPQTDAILKSLHARELAALRRQSPQQQQQAPTEPQFIVQQQDGSYAFDPSAHAEWKQWFQGQLLSQVQQETAPLKQAYERSQAEQAAVQRQQQIDHFATTTYQDVTTWPGMDSKENKVSVANALMQMNVDPQDPREIALALNAAYRQIVLPTLSRQAEAKLLDSLKTKAAASTGVNPGSAAPSATRAVTKFADLSADAWR